MADVNSEWEEEIDVLKAIYFEDLVDRRRYQAWERWKAPKLRIKLYPSHGDSGRTNMNTSVDLLIDCPSDYPKGIPMLALENANGLKSENLGHLKQLLKHEAQKLKGQVMLYQLCEVVREYLHDIGQLPAGAVDPSKFKSFHEGMVETKNKEIQSKVQAQQQQRAQSEAKEAAEIKEELARRRALLSDEINERRRSFSHEPPQSSNVGPSTSEQQKLTFADGVEHNILFSRQRVSRQRCHPLNTECVALDVGNGDLLLVQTWVLNAKKKSDLENVNSLLPALEKEFQSVSKLSHRNLVPYLALNIENFTVHKTHTLKITLVQPFQSGSTLNDHISTAGPLSVEQCANLSRDVLNVLNYLHSKDVLHKNLLCDCIWKTSTGFMLSDFSLRKRLLDLADTFSPSDRLVIAGAGKPNRRSDLFLLGIIVLSVSEGRWMGDRENIVDVPEHSDPILADFVNTCRGRDKQLDCETLLGHDFLNSNGPKRHSRRTTETEETTESQSEAQNLLISATRLKTEFEFLQVLGKGAFGDVWKMRNKLDRHLYAIKRIELGSRHWLTKTLTREVKLLSVLNHENVVRYYNSWIETEIRFSESRETSIVTTEGHGNDSLQAALNIEAEAPPPQSGSSVEWSLSLQPKQRREESSDSEDDDPLDVFGTSSFYKRHETDSAEDIVFESASDSPESNDLKQVSEPIRKSTEDTSEETSSEQDYNQKLYIQMEFCESTLRQKIDRQELGHKRAWQLFREILQGLAYIHSLGMIHRDIKPGNIFLNSEYHVKIGDFGLAQATRELSQHSAGAIASPSAAAGLTTNVGTALYLAPEMCNESTKTLKLSEPNKVDIYSCGIVLFEIFYRLLEGMERAKILTGIRASDPIIPADWPTDDDLGPKMSSEERSKLITLLKWTLNSDPSARPSAKELLQSDLLPSFEQEQKLKQDVLEALAKPQSSLYSTILETMFDKSASVALDYCYDKHMYEDFKLGANLLTEKVRETLVGIFKLHGFVALNYNLPHLIPRTETENSILAKNERAPCVLNETGLIVSLPFELRSGFARLVARGGLKRMKRYSFGYVYRYEKGSIDYHPRQWIECALDVVTSSNAAVTSSAELLSIVGEIAAHYPQLSNYCIRTNHMQLLRAVLLYYGIADTETALRFVQNWKKTGRRGPKATIEQQKKSELMSALGVNDQTADKLMAMLDLDGPLDRVAAHLRCITQRKSSESAIKAKEALSELEMLKLSADNIGVGVSLSLAPGMVFQPHLYSSGLLFEAVATMPGKKKSSVPVKFAVGGRYDALVSKLRKPYTSEPQSESVSCIGLSIAFDRLVDLCSDSIPNQCDVIVCTAAARSMIKETLALVHKLWAAKIRADFLHEPVKNMESLEQHCQQMGIKYLLLLLESGQVCLKSLNGGSDRKFHSSETVEVLLPLLEAEGGAAKQSSSGEMNVEAKAPSGATAANMAVQYAVHEKLAYNTKKRYETQIRHSLNSIFANFSPKKRIEVFATEAPASVLKALAAELDFKNGHTFETSSAEIGNRFGKYKKELRMLFDGLRPMLLGVGEANIVLVYSLSDDFYKLIM